MTHITVPTDVLYQELDGEAILLNMSNGLYFSLDPVGTRIWALLSETGDSEVVLAQMLAEYDVDAAMLRSDMERLLAELTEAGLLIADETIPQ